MSRFVVPGLFACVVFFAASARAEEAPAPEGPCGIAFEKGTPAWADVLAKAKAEGKPAFVDFSTEWCGWCRRMEKDTFSQKAVGEVMKGFVNVTLDAEKGEGPALAKRFGIDGFPTMIVVDAAGDEVDRITGYLPPEEFTEEAQRILRGEGTIPALRRKVAESPDDIEAGIALASKLATAGSAEAASLFEGLVATSATKDRPTQGKVRLAWASALLAAGRGPEALAQAETILKDFADTPAAADVVPEVGRAVVGAPPARALAFLETARPLAKEPRARFQVEELAVMLHRSLIAQALARQAEAAGDDPDLLNQVAWASFEQKVNVREALGWARKAVELSQGAPEVLDTLANLQWLLDMPEDAIATEEQAAAKADGGMKVQFEATLAGWRGTRAKAPTGDATPSAPVEAPEPK